MTHFYIMAYFFFFLQFLKTGTTTWLLDIKQPCSNIYFIIYLFVYSFIGWIFTIANKNKII